MAKRITPQQIERWKQQAEEVRSSLFKGDGDADALTCDLYRDTLDALDVPRLRKLHDLWKLTRVSDGGTFDRLPPDLWKLLNERPYNVGFARVTDMPELFCKAAPNARLTTLNFFLAVGDIDSNRSQFGATVHITFSIPDAIRCAVSLSQSDNQVLDALRDGVFRLYVIANRKYRCAEIDISSSPALRILRNEIDTVLAHRPIHENELANVLAVPTVFDFVPKREVLQISAAYSMSGSLFDLFEDYYSTIPANAERSNEKRKFLDIALPIVTDRLHDCRERLPLVAPLIRLAEKPSTEVKAEIFAALFESISNSEGRRGVFSELRSLHDAIGTDSEGSYVFSELCMALNVILVARFSPDGLSIPSISSRDFSVEHLRITYEDLPVEFVLNFWTGLIHIPLIDLHYVLTGKEALFWSEQFTGDISDHENEVSSGEGGKYAHPTDSVIDMLQLDADVEDATETLEKLLDEACANKVWTIPPRAYCDVKFGNFTGIFLTEVGERVHFLAQQRGGLCMYGYIEPVSQRYWMQSSNHVKEGEVLRSFELSILHIVAAIIRDFWVIEERESAFSVVSQPKTRRVQANSTDPIIIYLPRVRYTNRVRTQRVRSELDLITRAKHFVRAHLRHSANISAIQVSLAKHHGFLLPPGFTFVRPHERGGGERTRIYRSRSALSLLFDEVISEVSGSGRSEWFEFEKNTVSLLEKLGFHTLHRGASGDGGVDILAWKLEASEVQNWLVQCKCWTKPVGVKVLRELMGSRADYGSDHCLMAVTMSRFTRDALDYANRHDIQLVDGNDLQQFLEVGRTN